MLKGNYAYECIPKLKKYGSWTGITIDPNPLEQPCPDCRGCTRDLNEVNLEHSNSSVWVQY